MAEEYSDRQPSYAMSPVGRDGLADVRWANDIAVKLQKCTSNYDSPNEAELNSLIKESSRYIMSNLPNEFLSNLVNEAKSLVSVVERSCLDNLEKNNERFENENSSNVDKHMAHIVGRKIPQGTSKYIAREIYSRLIAAGEDISSTEGSEESEHDIPVDIWKSARGSFDVRNEALLNQKIEEANNGHHGFAVAASSVSGSESITQHSSTTANGSKPGHEDLKQRSAAFKKFKQVLGSGTGFRIIKHNHGGGRKTRVLKYNAQKNRLFWESSKMLGGEQISCSRIVKVHREVTIVYIWYMTGGRHGSVKKMVGFETQREADAQILELALLYLQDAGSHRRS